MDIKNMNEQSLLESKTASKSLFQQFYQSSLVEGLYNIGFKIGLQMIDLRDRLIDIFFKQNKRKMNKQEVYDVIDLMKQMMCDIGTLFGVDIIFREIYNKLLNICKDCKKGDFQQAVNDVTEIVDNSQVKYGMFNLSKQESEPAVFYNEPEPTNIHQEEPEILRNLNESLQIQGYNIIAT